MPKVLEDARYITKKPVGKKPEVRIQALDDAEDEDPDPYDGFSSWQSMELMEVMERTEDWIQDLKHRIALNSLPKR
ncbi:MAG: hypothetical protein LBE27_05690 [Deltaproteobacteria bacterium]|nr:hypothetical protein [Deltaproteobacteria bacterium]